MRPVNIIAKIRKVAFGSVVYEGERTKAYIRSDGKAAMVRNPNLMLGPDDYELVIKDEDYDKLLTSSD